MLVQRDDDRLDHLAMPAGAAADMDVGLGVGRATLVGEPRQRALGIGIAKQRAGIAPRSSLGQDVDRCVEPDGDRPGIQ